MAEQRQSNVSMVTFQSFGVVMAELQDRDDFEESMDLPRMALVSQLSKPGYASNKLQKNYMKNNKIVRQEKRRILRNVLILSLVFLLNFTSFRSIQILQVSGVFMEEKTSMVGLISIYASLFLACMFLSPLMCTHLGYKWCIVVSIIPYGLYMVASLYPSEVTIIPTSIFVGLGAALLWPAKCSYLTEASKQFADWSGEDADVIINRFFGIFFFVYQTAQIWGNLISSYVLLDLYVPINATGLSTCGALYCPGDQQDDGPRFPPPNDQQLYTVCGIYAGLCFLSMLIAIMFLSDNLRHKGSSLEKYDSLDREDANLRVTTTRRTSVNESSKCKASCELLVSTLTHLKKCNQLLLIPISIYSGLQQGFFWSDFTKSYVHCSLGIFWMVMLIFICHGGVAAISSFLVGYLANCIGRVSLIALGGFVQCALLLTIFLWQPDSDWVWVFFTISALWGLADAIWKTMINGYGDGILYFGLARVIVQGELAYCEFNSSQHASGTVILTMVLFTAMYACVFMEDKDAAFTNYKLWESLGLFLAFGSLHFNLCVFIKIYAVMAMLIIGLIGYFCAEKRTLRKQ